MLREGARTPRDRDPRSTSSPRAEVLLSAYAEELDGLHRGRPPRSRRRGLELPSDVPRSAGRSGERALALRRGRPRVRALVQTRRCARRSTAPTTSSSSRTAGGRASRGSAIATRRSRSAPPPCPNANGHVGEVAMQLVTSVAARRARRSSCGTSRSGPRWARPWGGSTRSRSATHRSTASSSSRARRRTPARFLVPNVRAFLMALARFDVPTLEIDPPRRTASPLVVLRAGGDRDRGGPCGRSP